MLMIPTLNQVFSFYSLLRHFHVTRDEIMAFQNRQLRRLINNAYHNVPYYRRIFDGHRIKPQDIRTVSDLPSIPITSRTDLQKLPLQDRLASGVDERKLIVRKTSGSTTEPLVVLRTWFEESLLMAFIYRSYHYSGLRMRDRRAHIKLRPQGQKQCYQLFNRVLQALGLHRHLIVSFLEEQNFILNQLKKFHPDVIQGYPGVLSRIAVMMSHENRRFFQPRFIITGAEVLTPLMRERISEGFKTRVFDFYASHEFNLLAWECRETGEYHTCDDSVILEVVKNGQPADQGERGEVVVTNLHSFAMPFIRYRLGDIVTKGSEICKCGLPFSTIRKIQGRMTDYFSLPGGRMIHPYEIVLLIVRGNFPWIRQYQLIQEKIERIILRIVVSENATPHELTRLKEVVGSVIGPGVGLWIEQVQEIELEPSGKFQSCRSLVRSEYDGIRWDELG